MGCNGRLPIAVALLFLAGCGRSLPETAPVTGRITLDGNPVPKGRIVFVPDEGRPAIGAIQPDGTYRLTTFAPGDGAVLGHHTVTIQANEVIGGAVPGSFEEEIEKGQRGGVLRHLVPEQYNSPKHSGLSVQVGPGPNEIDFDLHR